MIIIAVKSTVTGCQKSNAHQSWPPIISWHINITSRDKLTNEHRQYNTPLRLTVRVIHCESYNLQAREKSPLTGRNDHSRGRNIECCIGLPYSEIYLFAAMMLKLFRHITQDSDKTALQKGVNALQEWTQEWFLKLNASKCGYVLWQKCWKKLHLQHFRK